MATVAVTHFSDRLAESVERKRSGLVVGLDPVLAELPDELHGAEPADALVRFCCGIVDAVAPFAVAVKPQSAFFEAHGSAGARAFEEVCAYARATGLLVIADAKRGDIGSTARAYAAAFVEPRGDAPALADAVTVNPHVRRRLGCRGGRRGRAARARGLECLGRIEPARMSPATRLRSRSCSASRSRSC